MGKVRTLASLVLVSSLILGIRAQAVCDEHYENVIEIAREKQLNRQVKSTGLTVLTIIFPPAGIFKVASLAASTKMSIDGVKGFATINELELIKTLFKQAELGEGSDLEAVLEVIRRERPETNLKWIGQEIRRNNIDNLYCTEAGLANFSDLLRSLGASEELSNSSIGLFGEVLTPPLQSSNSNY